MPFEFALPTSNAELTISVEPGSSVVFVGPNGGGKTRLAARIESDLQVRAHRISAHRALTLNTDVPKIRESLALAGLRTGHASEEANLGNRIGSRWGQKPAVL